MYKFEVFKAPFDLENGVRLFHSLSKRYGYNDSVVNGTWDLWVHTTSFKSIASTTHFISQANFPYGCGYWEKFSNTSNQLHDN